MAMRRAVGGAIMVATLSICSPAFAQDPAAVTQLGDSLVIRLVDADLRAAVQVLSRYLDRPLVFGALPPVRVTLETPQPVGRAEALPLLRSLLATHDLQLVEEGDMYRVTGPPALIGQAAPGAAPQQQPVDLHIIRLSHARAADVAATVNALYGRASALGELGAPRPTLSSDLGQNRVPPVQQAPPPAAPDVVIGRNASIAGEITIVPDTRTNSLLVRASPADFELIRAAVAQIDVRPLQVLIEVVIAEARRDRGFSIGLASDLPTQRVSGATNTTVEASTLGLGLGDFVVEVMRIGGVDLDLTLQAAAARGDVSILSRPVVLAANNEWAQILVGSQRPFVQVQRSLPTDAPMRDQIVQYMDVGTQLNVRPTINPDGYVMLEVTQEVNAATNETAFDAPIISTRSVQTQLLVRDGQTAVLGGLSDRQRDSNRAGIPFLSEIPLIGWIFGRHSRRTTETELFVFLTPRLVLTDEDLDETTVEVQNESRRVRGTLRRELELSDDSPPPTPSQPDSQDGTQ